MDIVWSDCDIFDSRTVCMKAPSIYIIIARLVKITGLEWTKMYENSTMYWYGVPKMGRLVDVANNTDQTQTKGLYISRKII